MKNAVCVLLAVVLGGCSSGPKGWSEEPLSTVSASLPDLDSGADMPFTIDVPVRFTQQRQGSRLEWSLDPKDDLFDPHISVRLGLNPQTHADALDSTPKNQIVRDKRTADGFVITSRLRDQIVRAETWTRVSDEYSLNCFAVQARDHGVPATDATLVWLEKICQSVKIARTR